MSKTDNLFDTTLTRPLVDLVTVNGRDMARGEVIRRIESEKRRGLAELKNLCLTHESWDILKLVEAEQSKRLNRKILIATVIGIIFAGFAALFSGLALLPRADSGATSPPPGLSPQSK